MPSRRGPDNSVRVAITGTVRGQNFANILHAQLTTSSSIAQADLDAWTLSFFNAWKTAFQAQMSTDVAVSSAKTICYTPGGSELISVAGTGYAGTGVAVGAPGAASKVVSWVTTVYWRGGKPRTYVPSISTGDLTAGTDQLAAGTVTAMKTAASGFRTAANALTSGTITSTVLGFVSFFSGNAPRVAPLFFPFTGSTVHPRVGIQRRRDGRWIT